MFVIVMLCFVGYLATGAGCAIAVTHLQKKLDMWIGDDYDFAVLTFFWIVVWPIMVFIIPTVVLCGRVLALCEKIKDSN